MDAPSAEREAGSLSLRGRRSLQGGGLLPLRLEGIYLRQGSVALLCDISLEVRNGDFMVVLGANGAGKSLLLKVMHGLLKPSDGRVRWLGAAARNAEVIRRRQAMVFPKPFVLRRSALANITFALALRGVKRRARRPQAACALRAARLETLSKRNAATLSSGQKQLLALARAWAVAPDIMFLDEPCANLDPAHTHHMEELMSDIHRQGTTIVMATHDLGQARRLAGRIVFMQGGHVLEDAGAQRFFEAPQSASAAAFLAGQLPKKETLP